MDRGGEMNQTSYCPRGCQTYTGSVHPQECGACGAYMTLDPSSYEEAQETIEENEIVRFAAREARCNGVVERFDTEIKKAGS
jgi:hypothetical protein